MSHSREPSPVSPKSPSAGSKALIAVAAILVASSGTLHWLRSVDPLGLDQGLFACFTQWLPEGLVPYRDIWDSKPPGIFLTYGMARLLPGDLVSSIWRLESLWLLATMALVFLIAKKLWGSWSGLLAAAVLLVAMTSPGWGGYWARGQAEVFLALPMLASALCALRAIKQPKYALLCGVFVGMATLYKLQALLPAGAWLVLWAQRLPPREMTRRFGAMGGGMLIPWGLVLLWIGLLGGLQPMWEALYTYNRSYAAAIAPPWSELFRGFFQNMVRGAPWLVLAAAFGIARGILRREQESSWLLAFIALAGLGILSQRQLAGYHFLLAIPPLTLAATWGIIGLIKEVRHTSRIIRTLATVGLLLLVLVSWRNGRDWSTYLKKQGEVLSGKVDWDDYARRLDRPPFSPAQQVAVANHVQSRTSPDDTLLVWGLSPGIYALANRRPSTRFAFHQVLLTEAPLSLSVPGLESRRAALLQELDSKRPAYIIVGTRDANAFEPVDSSTELRNFVALRELVQKEYTREATIGRFLLYARKPGLGHRP